jgi:hypothetical protein
MAAQSATQCGLLGARIAEFGKVSATCFSLERVDQQVETRFFLRTRVSLDKQGGGGFSMIRAVRGASRITNVFVEFR